MKKLIVILIVIVICVMNVTGCSALNSWYYDSFGELEAYVVPMVYLGGIESIISPINADYDKVEGQGSRVPIYRFDSKSEIDEFEKIINENCLWQAENQNNCFSFHEKYDEAFFAENSLVFVYFSATVAYQYGIVDIKYNQDTFCVYIEQTNNPGIVPEVVNGRGTIIEVSKEKLNGIQFFDAFVK